MNKPLRNMILGGILFILGSINPWITVERNTHNFLAGTEKYHSFLAKDYMVDEGNGLVNWIEESHRHFF